MPSASLPTNVSLSRPQSYRVVSLYHFVSIIPPVPFRGSGVNRKDAGDSHCDGRGCRIDSKDGYSAVNVAAVAVENRPPPPEGRLLPPAPLAALREEIESTLLSHDAQGVILLAPEGVNGTICYPHPADGKGDTSIDRNCGDDNDDPVLMFLRTHPVLGGEGLRTRVSECYGNGVDAAASTDGQSHPQQQLFHRLKVKIKSEIVTIGFDRENGVAEWHRDTAVAPPTASTPPLPTLCDPLAARGTYVPPGPAWDRMCRDPDVLVVDARNDYEIELGTFESAVNPLTRKFCEFPMWLERYAEGVRGNNDCDGGVAGAVNGAGGDAEADSNGNNDDGDNKARVEKMNMPKAVAMFCTGGIRCEKATSYAILARSFPENVPIYHLDGGILAYLDDLEERRLRRQCVESNGGTEKVEEDSDSTFRGECFVFDKRVAVGMGCRPTEKYVQCHGCRGPMEKSLLLIPDEEDGTGLPLAELSSNDGFGLVRRDKSDGKEYVPGLTCPRCHASSSRASLERFAARRRQVELAAREGRRVFWDNKTCDGNRTRNILG